MTIKLTDEMRSQLLEVLELHKGYFGANVQPIIDCVNGVRGTTIKEEAKDIIAKVERASGIGYSEMASKNRHRNTVIARQYAIYKVYEQLHHRGYTLMEIGRLFNRDHATIIYSVKTVKFGLQVNDYLLTKINENYR